MERYLYIETSIRNQCITFCWKLGFLYNVNTTTKLSQRLVHKLKRLFAKCLPVINISWIEIQLNLLFIDTLGYKLEKAGFLSAAPYLAMGVLLAISGYFADICQVKGYLTTTQVRRYFNCGGKINAVDTVFQVIFLKINLHLQSNANQSFQDSWLKPFSS